MEQTMNQNKPFFYHVLDDIYLAKAPRTSSGSFLEAVLKVHKPDVWASYLSAHFPEAHSELELRKRGRLKFQLIRPRYEVPKGSTIILPVRDPVDRFCSAYARLVDTQRADGVDAALSYLENESEFNGKYLDFKPQVVHLIEGATIKLFSFPKHINDMLEILSIPEEELPSDINVAISPKPELTHDQLARVQAIYADDIALYESIEEAGQILTVPDPEPEPLPLITAEQHIARSLGNEAYVALRISAFQDLETKLAAAEKTAPKLVAMRAWIDGIVGLYATDLQPRNDWPAAPHTFEETVQEAAYILSLP
jgi:hypothetical protein